MSPGKICQADPSCILTMWLSECWRIFIAILSPAHGIGLPKVFRRMAVAGVNDRNTRRRNFAVEPVLFVGQRPPRSFHALVAIEDRLTVRAFGKMHAVVGIFAENFGLLHDVFPC